MVQGTHRRDLRRFFGHLRTAGKKVKGCRVKMLSNTKWGVIKGVTGLQSSVTLPPQGVLSPKEEVMGESAEIYEVRWAATCKVPE